MKKLKYIISLEALVLLLLLGFSLSSFDSATEQQDKELQESIKRGEQVYTVNCVSCHLPQGEGIPGAFPPLAKSDYLLADPDRAIRQIMSGISGEITVNGQTYNNVMPAQSHLSDEELADVMNYVLHSWGNKGKKVSVAQVKAQRAK